jgi:predicted AAA+ superfamily ATPase
MLPKVYHFARDKERQQFLSAYTLTYLKEEVWAEQLVKKLDPFRSFLEVAAQVNGKVINYSNIARDVGVEDKTIKNYFSILEDTLIAFMLMPYRHSFRKRLNLSPKFYFFDVGVARSLARMLNIKPQPGTSYYGELFESFIIAECIKLSEYHQLDFKFSYLMTGAGAEVDLVVERPGAPLLLIEIKSNENVARESYSRGS